jgi:hypothetical protein
MHIAYSLPSSMHFLPSSTDTRATLRHVSHHHHPWPGGQSNSTAFISTAHSKVAQLVELGLEEVKRGGLNTISSCSLLLHRLLVPHAILLPVPAKRQRRQHVMNHLSLLYRGLHLPRLPPSHHHGFVTDFIVSRSDEKSLWGGAACTPCD